VVLARLWRGIQRDAPTTEASAAQVVYRDFEGLTYRWKCWAAAAAYGASIAQEVASDSFLDAAFADTEPIKVMSVILWYGIHRNGQPTETSPAQVI
jgi:hypothetical protein